MPLYIRNQLQIGFAEEAIASIREQTDPDWRLILVDDGSPLVEPVQSLIEHARTDQRVDCHSLPMNSGSWMARNVGIRVAALRKAPFVLFADADDHFDPRRLESTRRIFESDSDVVMTYSAFSPIDEMGELIDPAAITPSIREILEVLDTKPPQGHDAWREIGTEHGYATLTSTVSVRLSTAVAHPFPPELVSEDTYAWYHYMSDGRLAFDPATQSRYRVLTSAGAGSSVRLRVGEGYYGEKSRVDRAAFISVLTRGLLRNQLSVDDYRDLLARFLVRLAETMARELEIEAAKQLIIEARATDLCAATEHIERMLRTSTALSGSCLGLERGA